MEMENAILLVDNISIRLLKNQADTVNEILHEILDPKRRDNLTGLLNFLNVCIDSAEDNEDEDEDEDED